MPHPQPPAPADRPLVPLRGRGAASNPANRFERIDFVPDPEAEEEEDSRGPRTVYLRDATRGIIARNDSPDIGFETSVNPYRGCEHGCIYCFARPFHEYLGFSAGLDFETKLFAKTNAAEVLRETLRLEADEDDAAYRAAAVNRLGAATGSLADAWDVGRRLDLPGAVAVAQPGASTPQLSLIASAD
jgi:hypothetical protein